MRRLFTTVALICSLFISSLGAHWAFADAGRPVAKKMKASRCTRPLASGDRSVLESFPQQDQGAASEPDEPQHDLGLQRRQRQAGGGPDDIEDEFGSSFRGQGEAGPFQDDNAGTDVFGGI